MNPTPGWYVQLVSTEHGAERVTLAGVELVPHLGGAGVVLGAVVVERDGVVLDLAEGARCPRRRRPARGRHPRARAEAP